MAYPKSIIHYPLLVRQIIKKYGTQTNFAKELGITKQALSYKLSGKNGISNKDIALWCQLLDIPLEQIWKYFFDVEFDK